MCIRDRSPGQNRMTCQNNVPLRITENYNPDDMKTKTALWLSYIGQLESLTLLDLSNFHQKIPMEFLFSTAYMAVQWIVQ